MTGKMLAVYRRVLGVRRVMGHWRTGEHLPCFGSGTPVWGTGHSLVASPKSSGPDVSSTRDRLPTESGTAVSPQWS